MEAAPIICPACGELIIVSPDLDGTLLIPAHPDRVTPFETCMAAQAATTPRSRNGK